MATTPQRPPPGPVPKQQSQHPSQSQHGPDQQRAKAQLQDQDDDQDEPVKTVGQEQYKRSMDNEAQRGRQVAGVSPTQIGEGERGRSDDADAEGPDNPLPGEPGGPTAGHYDDSQNVQGSGRGRDKDRDDKLGGDKQRR